MKEKLINILTSYGKAAIAFSAGVDSTFLLKAAHETLKENTCAIIGNSQSFPEHELKDAIEFCKSNNIAYYVVEIDQLSVEGFRTNPPERCYYCKKALFTAFLGEAQRRGFQILCDGSNADDTKDYRPGMKALKELGIKSPLMEAGLTKADIRALSKEYGLGTWDKPSFACLATRIPYGEEITEEKLRTIGSAEKKLLDLGFRQFRVRLHGDIARIEIEKPDFEKIIQPDISEEITSFFKQLGFTYVTLDLAGFKSGSMNKNIKEKSYDPAR